MTNPSVFPGDFQQPAAAARLDEDFARGSAYVYQTWKIPPGLRLTGGWTYEHLTYPGNFRAPPLTAGQESRERFNPKASLVWEPWTNVVARAAYARSLGGVSLDETFRLEPTQLAGFSQDFRSLLPESLVGSVPAPDHQIVGAALDLKLARQTYVGLEAGWREADARRSLGVFDYYFAEPAPNIVTASTRQHLRYDERIAAITVHQIINDSWIARAQYRVARAELEEDYPALAPLAPSPHVTHRAELHRVQLALRFLHPSGFFARAEGHWYFQQNLGSAELAGVPERELPDESHGQLDLAAGFRLRRQRGEITLGVLNLAADDYRLNPISSYDEMPRERVFYAQLRLRF
jgi:hypothetical protein